MTTAERVEMAGDESSGTKSPPWMGAGWNRMGPSPGSPRCGMRAPWATTRRPAQAMRLPAVHPHGGLARCLALTWRGAVGALVAFSALAGTPTPASAQEITTFFDSTGGIRHTAHVASPRPKFAQGVHTGSHPGGYTLTEVRLYAEGTDIASSSLSLRKDKPLGTEIATLQYGRTEIEPPGTHVSSFLPPRSAAVYTAPANTVMDPDTTYYVKLDLSSGSVGLPIVRLDASRLYSAAAGHEWSVADGVVVISSYNGNPYYYPYYYPAIDRTKHVLRIAFLGYRNPPASEQQVEADPPTVDGTSRVNGAGGDQIWTEGEKVEVTVPFSESVDVDTSGGTPSIGIGLGGPGGTARSAAYVSGSGTAELAFGYTLVADDGSHGTMSVSPNSLALNGGTIRGTQSEADAQLTHVGAVVLGRSAQDDGPQARFRDVPKRHDGETSFTVGLGFSSAPSGVSAKRDAASVLEVTGGSVTGARETTGGATPVWEVTVTPDGRDEVTVRLPVRACDEPHAVCLDGAPLFEAVEATVPGPLPTVSITAAPPVSEGAAAGFALTRTGDAAQALTVTVQVSESGDVLAGAPPGSATFEAGSDGATLTVRTDDDEVAEDASTVIATVSAGEGYTVDGTSGSAGVRVEDDDAAPVVATASPIVAEENATAVATLSATDADTAAEDVSWSIPAGAPGGTDGSAFALTAEGVLTFKTAKDYEAPDDIDDDGAYEVTVRVTDGSNPVDAALVVRLADVDDTAPVLSSASVDGPILTLIFNEALDEGSAPAAGSFAVTVRGAPRTVGSVTVSGNAAMLRLSPGATAHEAVTVRYTAPETAALRDAAGNRVASIAGTEAANETAPVVSIEAASTPIREGAAAAFVVRRTGAPTPALTVAVSISQSGSVLAGAPPSSATFAPGASEVRLALATVNDTTDEADARVGASAVAGEGYEVDAAKALAWVDVFDDDLTYPAGRGVTLWSTTMTWTALGNRWYGGFVDAFSDPGWSEDGQAFRIWYLAYDAGGRRLLMAHDGSGGVIAEPEKLTLHVGGLEVGPGSALSAFARAAVGRHGGVDDAWQVGERVSVRLMRTVEEAAPAPTGPAFSVADAQVAEASGAPLGFRVTLDAPAESAVSVRYRTSDGTARAGEDYVAAHGAVRFAPGETVQTVEVQLLEDVRDESAETLTLTLSDPSPSRLRLVDDEATGTIAPPALPAVSIAASTPVSEGAAASFTLTRTGDTAEGLTVAVSVSESEAVVSGTPPTSVTFAAGSAGATLSAATEDDEAVEAASTVTATVSAGDGYTVNGASGSAGVVVEDDDAAPVVETASPIVVAENAAAVATLAASDADTASEDLAWSIPEGSAGGADGARFTLTAEGVLSFKAAKDYEAPDDADGDGDYEVTVGVTDGSNAVGAALVVRLSDLDDTAPVLSSASVDGATLTLTFDEALDGESVPPASLFAVTVAGSARTVDAVETSGGDVVLTLSSAVTARETVTVGYTVPTGAGATPVRDAAGNAAAAFANTAVTNETPALPAVSIAASTPVSEGAAASFTLTRTGDTAEGLTVAVSVSESEAVVSGTPPTSVTFAAGSAGAVLSVVTEDDEAVEAGSTVTATVSAGSGYTVNGASGSAEVVVEDDDAAPVVETASPIVVAENATAVATLAASDADTASEELAWSIPEGSAGGADGARFTLTAEGVLSFKAAKDYEAPDDADGDGDYEVTVGVTDGSNAVGAALVVRLSDLDDTAPVLSSASVDGATLTLTFDEALDRESVPPASSFAVTVAGSARTVDAVAVSGSTVELRSRRRWRRGRR